MQKCPEDSPKVLRSEKLLGKGWGRSTYSVFRYPSNLDDGPTTMVRRYGFGMGVTCAKSSPWAGLILYVAY
jgi:hypothetical protein